MANPKNNFHNFFNNPEPVMEKHKPKPPQVVEALMVITSQDHEWYKNPVSRMVILMTMERLAHEVRQEAEANDGKVDLPVHAAAFLMILGDLAIATRQYASEEELRKFPDIDKIDED